LTLFRKFRHLLTFYRDRSLIWHLKKSVPNRPTAVVGSEHTRKGCVNLLPFIRKVTVCCPLISRVSSIGLHRGNLNVTFRYAGLHYRNIGASVQYQASGHSFYICRYSWSTMLQYDDRMGRDGIFGNAEAKGAELFTFVTSKGRLCLRIPITRGLWFLVVTRSCITLILRLVRRLLRFR